MNQSASLLTLKIFAALAALGAVVQSIIGFAFDGHGQHGNIGYATFAATAVAAVAAFFWSRSTGDKGIFMHAAGMAVACIVQIGLAEMNLRSVHMAVGIFILLGNLALATLAFRRRP